MKKLYYRIDSWTSNKRKQKDFMKVEVTLAERRTAWGRKICKVEPVSGSGFIWVNEKSLTIK